MNKEKIMTKIVELQQEIVNYELYEGEILEKLDEIYFELENMEED